MAIQLPTTPAEAKAVLSVFNSKFERIIAYSFYKHPQFSYRATFDNVARTATTTTDIPTDEQIDAVLLQLRFFFVTNETTSFRYLVHSYTMLSLPADMMARCQAALDKWTAWRNAPARIGGYKNEKFFSIMVYGERIHRNQKDNCDVYDELMGQLLIKDFAMVELCRGIDEITRLASGIHAVNQEVLALP
ncbi:MAG: hypothetical protein Q7S40_20580 [Opitutaceae bacterium]|nr:hypothetical protein [Opitutaceae bacterium]